MRFRGCLVAGLVLLGASSAFGQSRMSAADLRDVRYTMQARKLLADDPALASVNIGVIVTDRIAVLWGPVPSAELAFRAELCVKTMVELVKVRNELFVNELVQPIRAPLKMELPPLMLPDMMPPKLPREVRPVFGAPGVLLGQEKADTRKPLAPTSVAKKAPVEIKVLPPEALAPLLLGTPQPAEAIEAERELADAIRTFLQSKTTYRMVQFAVQERRVFLRAAEQDADALHEAARGIARLPNVEGVVLVDRTPPR